MRARTLLQQAARHCRRLFVGDRLVGALGGGLRYGMVATLCSRPWICYDYRSD